jgi:cobyrinic acid a,c-diamide synthase
MKSIVIAAPCSGSGKTTITLGLMACLKLRGLTVAPFKVGPDFIDPGYHSLVCGVPSINLDSWICPTRFVRETFELHCAGADIAVIEGVMGLFDGAGGTSDKGSTAHVARITGSPVVLVVDAKSQARSAAALVKGFAEFDPGIRVCGVIFNNVASDNHGRILREAIGKDCPEIEVFGCIPRDGALHIPSRHLGLLTVEENPLPGEYLDHLVDVIRDHVDFALLWETCKRQPTEQSLPFAGAPIAASRRGRPVRIAVARDPAFCFVYEDNLRLLREAGAELALFSPIRDDGLPEDIDGIYLPGGYPEVFADVLAENRAMKGAIRSFAEAGMPVYAECGGFIYLSEGIRSHVSAHDTSATSGDLTPVTPFVGIFPVATRMLPRRKALGYREIIMTGNTLIGRKGIVARGHEFHYSEMEEMPASVERLYRVRKGGADLGTEGYRIHNCLASYVHLHFGSSPDLAGLFVAGCRKFRKRRLTVE